MMKGNYIDHADMKGNEILSRCRRHISNAKQIKEKLLTANDDNGLKILELYNKILVDLDSAMAQASLFAHVHPQRNIRDDAEKCEQEASKFATDLSLDENVYFKLLKGKNADLDKEGKRFLDETLRDFRHSGVDKDFHTRKKITRLKEELVNISQEFSQNIREEKYVIKLDGIKDLAGLPRDYIEAHQPQKDGVIKISTDYPDYIPFMKYAHNDAARKKLRHLFLNRGKDNGPVLRKLVEKRHELATLLGYSSYADYVVEDKMIKKASNIHSFIDKITALAKEGADREYEALLAFKKRLKNDDSPIKGYESAYLEEAFKKEKFNFDSQSVRPYFPYQQVRDGLLKVTSNLFNIRYVPVSDAQVWDESVETFDVYDESQKLGRIYLDMHPRDGKYNHAAQFTIRSGLNGYQYPEGALVCNFPNPKEGPALMEHNQVVTMFHEFGHLLHHIFGGSQKWISFSGVATEWDFVEAPSQFLEEWAWDKNVLNMFATHYKTKEPIPTDLVEKMRAADEFGKALSARQQMFYAKLSVEYYDNDPDSLNFLNRLKTLQATYSYFPYEEDTHFHHSFGHLDGYSAMYYTYMWSLSIAKDLFKPFKEDGLMNKEHALRFRDTILKPGGTKDAKDLVRDFLGRPFNFDAFETWLKKEPVLVTSR